MPILGNTRQTLVLTINIEWVSETANHLEPHVNINFRLVIKNLENKKTQTLNSSHSVQTTRACASLTAL